MFFIFTVAAFCIVCNMVSAATTPKSQKVYYDLENADNLFKEYLKEYNKSYDAGEYAKRIEVFKISLKIINELNAEHPKTVFGVTMFADLTPEEQKPYFGQKTDDTYVNKTVERKKEIAVSRGSFGDLPDFFDWRDKGVVTPVKNQGDCGSCFVFSAIGNIEGQYALKHEQCISFSEQYCLDCLKDTPCYGGQSLDVMQKLMDKPGLMKEDDYPYVGEVEKQCREDKSKMLGRVTGATEIDVDEDTLKQKLVEIGPLSVSLLIEDSDQAKFIHYRGDIISCIKETSNDTSHAVVLVGYGENHDGDKYWIIKNSYGPKWGEEGYFRLKRGGNQCNIVTKPARTAEVM